MLQKPILMLLLVLVMMLLLLLLLLLLLTELLMLRKVCAVAHGNVRRMKRGCRLDRVERGRRGSCGGASERLHGGRRQGGCRGEGWECGK